MFVIYGVSKYREISSLYYSHIYNKPQIVMSRCLAARYLKFYTFIIYIPEKFK